jgi:hypothetical protein
VLCESRSDFTDLPRLTSLQFLVPPRTKPRGLIDTRGWRKAIVCACSLEASEGDVIPMQGKDALPELSERQHTRKRLEESARLRYLRPCILAILQKNHSDSAA